MKLHASATGLKACSCGSEDLQLHSRPGRKFGFAIACNQCNAMTPWVRLSSVARAVWNRGDRQPTIRTKPEGEE